MAFQRVESSPLVQKSQKSRWADSASAAPTCLRVPDDRKVGCEGVHLGFRQWMKLPYWGSYVLPGHCFVLHLNQKLILHYAWTLVVQL